MSKHSPGNERGLGESKRLTLALLILVLLGCRSGMGDGDYADAFKANMVAFRDKAVEVSNRPLPPTQGLTREEKRKAIADRLREDGKAWQESAERFRKLQPPSKFREVNRLSVVLFQEMADDQVQWADLILAKSPEAKGYADVSNARMLASMRRLTDELKRIGGPEAAHLEGSLKALEEMAQSQ